MLDRAFVIHENFLQFLENYQLPDSTYPLDVDSTVLLDLFESMLTSRALDLHARKLKDQGLGFYTIGSSGHECNAALGALFKPTDLAFLHYRSGAFFIQRAKQLQDLDAVILDQMRSLVAASTDPISSGRHKVFGSKPLGVPPQTSTIASHLPKAVGTALSIDLAVELNAKNALPNDSVVLCSFGDASANHATAQTAFNTTAWLRHQGINLPIIFICEDNGIGISVKTPQNWLETVFQNRPGLEYLQADGLDLIDVYQVGQQALDLARNDRKAVFLHVKTVRLMGHAGSDVESQYKTNREITDNEALDPLIATAEQLLEAGLITPDEIRTKYQDIESRIERASERALEEPKLSNNIDVMASVLPAGRASNKLALDDATRESLFGKEYKQLEQPRNLCQHLNYALTDILQQYPHAVMFGEDVGKKGGVYRVSANLQNRFGAKRIFDTLLDETSILGHAIGLAHNGLLPIPEIQFLAYTHNAEDQIRGEAATLSFFSNQQYTNPMVIRIAGLAYQKGFGGHFHNDNALAFLREIPGIVVACPSRGDFGAKLVREAFRLADELERVVVFLEPIALYMTKDLHEPGDNAWLSVYPEPGISTPFGAAQCFDGDDLWQERVLLDQASYAQKPSDELICTEMLGKSDVLVLTYGNGTYLSIQAAKLATEKYPNKSIRVIDLQWLVPLNADLIRELAATSENILIVDECRERGSLSEEICAIISTGCHDLENAPKLHRIAGDNTFIPIGNSWQYVLPSKETIAEKLVEVLG